MTAGETKMKPYYSVNNCLEYLERSARRFPDKTAFADENEKVTFSQLMEESMKIGCALKPYGLHTLLSAPNAQYSCQSSVYLSGRRPRLC